MPDPLLIDVNSILKMLSIGRSKFYELVSTGEFAPQPLKVFGKKKLYRTSDVKMWIDSGCVNREKFQSMRGTKAV